MDRISRNCNWSFNRASKKIKTLNLKFCSLIVRIYKKESQLNGWPFLFGKGEFCCS